MGECNYYLKARFRSAAEAKKALPRLVALLVQGERAYDFWQGSRGGFPRPDVNWKRPSTDGFWKAMREHFPLVYQYLRDLADIADWNNGLAGHLGCLVDPSEDRKPRPRAALFQVKDTLFLRLDSIWHCTDMGLLERWCREELGAVNVGSVSEEDFDRDDDNEDFDPFLAIRV